jgi:ABC-type uncharacterized transport system fused permease/ATPase subunit
LFIWLSRCSKLNVLLSVYWFDFQVYYRINAVHKERLDNADNRITTDLKLMTEVCSVASISLRWFALLPWNCSNARARG